MIRELANLPVATALPVGYFIGVLSYPDELRAEKEAIRRRTEKFKKLSSENDLAQFLAQVSGKKE